MSTDREELRDALRGAARTPSPAPNHDTLGRLARARSRRTIAALAGAAAVVVIAASVGTALALRSTPSHRSVVTNRPPAPATWPTQQILDACRFFTLTDARTVIANATPMGTDPHFCVYNGPPLPGPVPTSTGPLAVGVTMWHGRVNLANYAVTSPSTQPPCVQRTLPNGGGESICAIGTLGGKLVHGIGEQALWSPGRADGGTLTVVQADTVSNITVSGVPNPEAVARHVVTIVLERLAHTSP